MAKIELEGELADMRLDWPGGHLTLTLDGKPLWEQIDLPTDPDCISNFYGRCRITIEQLKDDDHAS